MTPQSGDTPKQREFDESAAHMERREWQFANNVFLNKLMERPDLADMTGFIDGARWQFNEDAKALADRDREIAELRRLIDMQGGVHNEELDALEAKLKEERERAKGLVDVLKETIRAPTSLGRALPQFKNALEKYESSEST